MKKALLNVTATISALFLLWLLISFAQVGFADPLGERNFSEWNAVVIFTERG